MKEVIAIIRMNKINETKEALSDVDIPAMTVRKVMGRGKGKVDYALLKGAEAGAEEAIAQLGPGPKFVPKRMLWIAVQDHNVEKCVRTIIKVNQTGQPGDGKIFVVPLTSVTRVRTGEEDAKALDESNVFADINEPTTV